MIIQDKIIDGSVITFYSYKGGVGRSMALANIACLLAKKGLKVLVIDWDLEAPGLHHFFKANDEKKGLIDILLDVNAKIKSKIVLANESNIVEYFEENLNKFICRNLKVNFKNENEGAKIDLIKSGKFNNSYAKNISGFDWIDFYKSFPSFFRILAQYLETKYDYILIDSRTGLSDTSGICTMLMPEKLVLVFAPNDQNIDGVINVAKQSIDYRLTSYDERNLNIYPLPSRIDSNNILKRPEWLNKYTGKFEKLFIEKYYLDECKLLNYFEKASIRYIHDYAFGEEIPVLSESLTDNKNISNDYNNFLDILMSNEQIWDLQSEEERINLEKKGTDLFNKALTYRNENNILKAIELYEEGLRFHEISDAYNDYAILLSLAANESKIQDEKKKLFNRSVDSFEKAIEKGAGSFRAYTNYSITLLTMARAFNDINLHTKNLKLLEDAIQKFPGEPKVYNSIGACLSEYGIMTNDVSYVYEGINFYKSAIKINPKNAMTYLNWANSIYALYQLESNDRYISEFSRKVKKGLSIDDTIPNGYYNWGTVLFSIALKKPQKQKIRILKQAITILEIAKKRDLKTYVIACCYALLEDGYQACENLKNALITNEILAQKVIEDTIIWNRYNDHPDFKAIFSIFNIKMNN